MSLDGHDLVCFGDFQDDELCEMCKEREYDYWEECKNISKGEN